MGAGFPTVKGRHVTRFWLDYTMLMVEAQQVIWLRWLKMAAGGTAADREARLMVSEKMAAAGDAGMHMMLGASPDSVLRGYRSKVRANRRRLSRRRR